LQLAGLDFVDAHAPFRDFGDLFIPDARDWRQMIARQKLNLELVSEMGVDTCTFHVGSKYYADYTLDQHREALYRSLDELLPLAEKRNVTICLENLVRPLSTADDLISYMKRYDSPYLGVCLDVGHANLKEKGDLHPDSSVIPAWAVAKLPVRWEKDIAETLQPYIVNCHVHDNRSVGDDHDLPGDGDIDFKRIVPILLNAPRLRNIQSEVLTARRNIPIRTVCENIRQLFGDSPKH
jgi:sugar phosphate isomerase/epimerase